MKVDAFQAQKRITNARLEIAYGIKEIWNMRDQSDEPDPYIDKALDELWLAETCLAVAKAELDERGRLDAKE